jgi:superoxide dismutase, Fe-Mn family
MSSHYCLPFLLLLLSLLSLSAASSEPLPLPELPFEYNALEPFISSEAVRLHHLKHHAAYTSKLNDALHALRSEPEHKHLVKQGIDFMLQHLDQVPLDQRAAIRNNGGGYVNHALFWQCLHPPSSRSLADPSSAPLEPSQSAFLSALLSSFSSFPAFVEQFRRASLGVFGSGWAWLVLDLSATSDTPSLYITTTHNQDTPAMQPLRVPLLALDVWEHAYYVDHRNDRASFVDSFFHIVNWDFVSNTYSHAIHEHEARSTTASHEEL